MIQFRCHLSNIIFNSTKCYITLKKFMQKFRSYVIMSNSLNHKETILKHEHDLIQIFRKIIQKIFDFSPLW